MSQNKYALIRYHALDTCFSNSMRKYAIEDLIEACNAVLREEGYDLKGVSRRQIYDDIRFMKSEAGYNVEFAELKDGRTVYYRYADSTFSIKKQGLNETELAQISDALAVVARFKGMPQFEWVEEVIAKFESKFGVKRGAEKIIGFDENLDYTAVKNISPLFNSILNKQAAIITYKDFKAANPYDVTFHPYYLKQYNNRWFCLGLDDETKKIRTMALDRILDIQHCKKKYVPNEEYDFNEYFEDVIGVTVLGPTEKVKLKVESSLWPYIETKPLHGTQRIIKRTKNEVIISIEVKINYELESLILSHGEKISVMEPENLRNIILSRARMIK